MMLLLLMCTLLQPLASHAASLPVAVPMSCRAEPHAAHTVHLAMSHHLDVSRPRRGRGWGARRALPSC
jgi:tartrate dehydratase alpha subunit/fumarate hydratase class I-like protein